MRKNKPATAAEIRNAVEAANASLPHGSKVAFDGNRLIAVRASDDPDRRLRELRAAKKRVGVTRESQIRWLLEFANGLPPKDAESARRISAELFQLAHLICNPGITEGRPAKLGSADQVDDLRRVHAGLREEILGPGMLGKWTIESTQLGNYQFGIYHGKPFYIADEGALFILACHQLLASSEAQRISRCAAPKCDRWFLRRKRGTYCSPECGAEAKSSRYFNTPAQERSARRHETYKDWVTRHVGKNVTVHRRGPRVVKKTEVQDG